MKTAKTIAIIICSLFFSVNCFAQKQKPKSSDKKNKEALAKILKELNNTASINEVLKNPPKDKPELKTLFRYYDENGNIIISPVKSGL